MTAVYDLWLWLMRRSAAGLAAFLTGVALFEFIQPVAIASFRDLELMQAIASFVPPAFLAMFNMPPGFLDQANLAGFLSLGFSHPVYHLLSAAAVIWFVARNLTGEIERGSIQIALSRPVSRRAIYASRVLGLICMVALVALAGCAGMIVGIAVGRPDGDVDYLNFAVLAVAAGLLLCCFGGVALVISAATDRMAQSIAWTAAFLLISFVVDYFAQLWSALEPIEPLSVFDYFAPIEALGSGTIPITNILVLAGIALVGAVAGSVIFERRDLP